MNPSLAGRNALVLGVERPAARGAAIALAEAGANVAVVTTSEDTAAEFAANSAANELWAIGVSGIALTSDGRETAVREAIADATAELGPISIVIWHASPLPRGTLDGLRSDPAVVVIITGEDGGALAAWTLDLAAAGLRANAVVDPAAEAAARAAGLTPHEPPQPLSIAAAAPYLAADASAALDGALIVAAP